MLLKACKFITLIFSAKCFLRSLLRRGGEDNEIRAKKYIKNMQKILQSDFYHVNKKTNSKLNQSGDSRLKNEK